MSLPAPETSAPRSGLRERVAQRLDSEDLVLPVLPSSAARVLELCNDEGCDARALAQVIHSDQSLAGHVLRVANSAAYAPTEQIVSLQQAVSRLGFATIRNIALSVALRSKAFSVEGHEAAIKALWIHSATAGAWAREIARMRRRSVEGAFLAGLLHDVGKPVVLQAAIDLARTVDTRPAPAELAACLDELHEGVGARLVETWSLPGWIREAILFHHHPERAREQPELARTACLADLLAHASTEPGAETERALRSHPVVQDLEIYPDELGELLERRDKVVAVAEAFA